MHRGQAFWNIICTLGWLLLKMIFFALGMLWAYPVTEYKALHFQPKMPFLKAIWDSVDYCTCAFSLFHALLWTLRQPTSRARYIRALNSSLTMRGVRRMRSQTETGLTFPRRSGVNFALEIPPWWHWYLCDRIQANSPGDPLYLSSNEGVNMESITQKDLVAWGWFIDDVFACPFCLYLLRL